MRKLILVLLLILFVLPGCGPVTPVAESTSSTPAPNTDATVDTSDLSPAAGWVLVRDRSGASAVFLFSKPDLQSATLGEIEIGASGELLGFNQTGEWVLAKFGEKTGWMPSQLLEVTSDR